MSDLELKRVKVEGMDFVIRPGTSDMLVLREIYAADEYGIFQSTPKIKHGDVVLDVGMNIGAFSIAAAGKGAKVYSYEPETANIAVAKENVAIHGVEDRITIDPRAVWGDEDGVYISPAQGNTGSSADAITNYDVFVESVTLNVVLEHHLACQEIAYLKMDVEGAEISILEATDPELLKRVKRIGMEYHGQTPEFGDMIRKLSGVFDLEIVGHPYPGENSGGMLYGTRK